MKKVDRAVDKLAEQSRTEFMYAFFILAAYVGLLVWAGSNNVLFGFASYFVSVFLFLFLSLMLSYLKRNQMILLSINNHLRRLK